MTKRVADGCLVSMLRCETCEWWLPCHGGEYGICMLVPEVDPDKGPKLDTFNLEPADMQTPACFGCVLWSNGKGE